MTDAGPKCEEECRSIVEKYGAGDRTVRQASVDGVIMTGRSLPKTVVAGTSDFDAEQQFIEHREEDLHVQTTASLLLSLRTAITHVVLHTPGTMRFTPLELWGELSRRGFDIERIAAGGLPSSIAAIVPLHITLLKLSDVLVVENLETQLGSAPSWMDVLYEWHKDQVKQGTTARRVGFYDLPSVLQTLIPGVSQEDIRSLTASHPEVAFAFSKAFIDRVTEWFAHLIADDLESALRGEAPSPELFIGIQPRRDRDEVGLWLWERFTVTALESWQTSSLLLEWSSNPVEGNELCPPRAMAERTVSREQAGELALERASETHSREPVQRGLKASYFTADAMERLMRGEWETASKIFGGLADLRPADGEAWNNLGFCQLAGNPDEALKSLRRAAVFPLVPTLICQANQVLALHLLDRDDEALELALRTLDGSEPEVLAILWVHPSEDGVLELASGVDVRQYLRELIEHISPRACTSSTREYY